jgi:methylated-DNA-[protein]-cysteine S-methyltransferase
MSTLTQPMIYTTLESPVGELLLVGDGEVLRGLHMQDGRRPIAIGAAWEADDAPFAAAREQLDEYFGGDRREFDLPLAPLGSEFQRCVWDGLLEIPYGETISYGELARRIGRPDRARAVGAANGANPIAIILPCHRVIGADGSLVGFGGGLETKRRLLELEAGILTLV